MSNILSFVGRSYCGKSFISRIVTELDSRFIHCSFSEPAKRIFCDKLGISREEFDISDVKDLHWIEFLNYKEELSNGNRYYWVDALFEEIGKDDYVVIDDVSSIEELQKIVENKGLVYKVVSNPEIRKQRGWVPIEEIDNHLSEMELDLSGDVFYTLTGGGIIYNNEGEAKLRGQIYNLLMSHFR